MSNSIREWFRLIGTLEHAKRDGRGEELLGAARENAEIQRIMMRPGRYEALNGSVEIGWGAAMLCFALSSYAYVVLPPSAWQSGVGWVLMLGACLAMPVSRWVIRRYITTPRTGYVAFRRGRSFWTAVGVAGVVGVVVSLGLLLLMRSDVEQFVQAQISRSPAHSRPTTAPGTLSTAAWWVLAGLGPVNAVLYLMMNGLSIREHRWKWLVVILLALGPLGICLSVPGGYLEVSRPVLLFLGLVCLGSGGVTLVLFLRHTQRLGPFAE